MFAFQSLFTSLPGANRPFSTRRLVSIQTVTIVYLLLIALGTLLLLLPDAQRAGVRLHWLDCLFTATSALTLTGLVVVSTADSWTMFGQLVILGLIQIGGLGYMVLATLIALRLGLRMRFSEHLHLEGDPGAFRRIDVWRLIRYALLATLVLEGVGALLLAMQFRTQGWGDAAFTGIFYAVSAFCNAGLDLSPGLAGLALPGLRGNVGILAIIGLLALLGGLGISVLAEMVHYPRGKRLSLHAKMVLTMTVLLLVLGALFFYLFELTSPFARHGQASHLLDALFMSINARSAGFSPFNLTLLSPPTLLLLMLLMFIGGAPGSTASGIKVTTVAVIGLAIATLLRRRSDIEAFHRRISGEMVRVALSLVSIYLLTLLLIILAVSMIEITFAGLPPTEATLTRYVQLVFEVVSAFTNVGLHTGIAPALEPASRVLLAVAMFIGRLGPLVFFYIFTQSKRPMLRRMPAESVMVG